MASTIHILVLLEEARSLPPAIRGLKGRGYTVTTLVAPFASKAVITFLRKHSVDVVLLVVRTGGAMRTIVRSLRQVRTAASTASLLIMGSHFQFEDVGMLLHAGVFSILPASCPPARLVKTVRQGLKNRQRLDHILQLSTRLEAAYAALSEDRKRLRVWSRDLSRLYGMNQLLAEQLNHKGVMQTLGVGLGEIIPHDFLSLFLKNGEQVWSSLQTEAPVDEAEIQRSLDATRQLGRQFVNADSSPHGATVRTRGCEFLLPLSLASEKIGLLRLVRWSNKPFDEYQSKVLTMIATPLALALRNADLYQQLESLAMKDALTEALNRRAFENILDRELKRARRYRSHLSLILLDIDHFKAINDQFGHQSGDRILRELAAIVKKAIREIDVLVRYGGEEFVVVLPGTKLDEAMGVAHRIKSAIDGYPFLNEGANIQLTVSMGVAHYPDPDVGSSGTLFEQADQALYAAKRNGRNRIEVAWRIEAAAAKVCHP